MLSAREEVGVVQDNGHESLTCIVSAECETTGLATVISQLAHGAALLADVLAAPPAPIAARVVATNDAGDSQQSLDARAHDIFADALATSPVRWLLSEEADEAIVLAADGPFIVAIDPLDGSADCAINTPLGTIFSIMSTKGTDGIATFAGDDIVAAGIVIYGPATLMILSIGDGVDVYHLDPVTQSFVRTVRDIRIPGGAREVAINTSNYRHWDPTVRMYIDDLIAGADGPRGFDFHMRWFAAVATEVYRVMVRGGIFLYPSEDRPGHQHGRLRLLYDAHPIAFLIEQAGGMATDGQLPILSKVGSSIHERTALVFGSADKVARFADYRSTDQYGGERSPLFGRRGLFRV